MTRSVSGRYGSRNPRLTDPDGPAFRGTSPCGVRTFLPDPCGVEAIAWPITSARPLHSTDTIMQNFGDFCKVRGGISEIYGALKVDGPVCEAVCFFVLGAINVANFEGEGGFLQGGLDFGEVAFEGRILHAIVTLELFDH